MTTMIEVKTADLIGPALDWAVARSEGFEWTDNPCVVMDAVDGKHAPVVAASCLEPGVVVSTSKGIYSPSTDWSLGGPLIKKYNVLLSPPTSLVHRNFGNFDKRNGWSEAGHWSTTIFGTERKHRRTSFWHPDDPLIPAMRAIIQFELGDTVQVPADLVRGGDA